MLATVLAVLAAAAPHSQTATLGPVTATATWRGDAPLYSDFHIAIDRDGQRLVDEAVTTKTCGKCLEPLSADSVVRAVDLDGDGEPEVVLQGYTGGAHCCTMALVYRYLGGAYAKVEGFFGNPGYSLEDLDSDGRPEFLTADDWSYAFGAYVESVSPIRVLALRNGRLADVTTSFRTLVRREARRIGHEFRLDARRKHTNVRPLLAAYVADLHRLGQHRHARSVLAAARRRGLLERRFKNELGPFGAKYLRELRKLLRAGGFLST